MNSKLFVLVLAILGATQAAKIPETDLLASDNVVEKVIDLLNWLSSINVQLAAELRKLDFSDKGLAKLVSDVAIAGNNQFLGRLKKLENGASATGKIVLECFEAQNTTVEKYLTSFGEELGECAKLDMGGVGWYMNEYIKGLDWYTDNFNTYVKDLEECKDEEAFTCIFGVMQKNGLTLTQLVLFGVGRIFEDLIGLVGGIKVVTDVASCGSKIISNHLDDYSQLIFNDAIRCIEQRL